MMVANVAIARMASNHLCESKIKTNYSDNIKGFDVLCWLLLLVRMYRVSVSDLLKISTETV